ncbi:hypothetical protein HYFRA_00013919 [Hymenoscyphus fraxineus]|uniref:NACHT domain-containing protein n=1 Tax=Hymenoscyphus fraxineus TaxID=746836 RepID=A0A9N9LDH0_9HELO|nr:hypothetical protein HYFRA_00013919 [Hymenoscyphus fraxineus]
MADVIGIIGSAVGVISFSLQVCKGLIQYYESYKDKRKDIERMVSALKSLTGTLETLKDPIRTTSFSKKQIENISSKIEDCEESIMEFSEVLGKIKESDVPGTAGTRNIGFSEKFKEVKGRLVYPFRESTILKLQESIGHVNSNLALAMQNRQSLCLMKNLIISLVEWITWSLVKQVRSTPSHHKKRVADGRICEDEKTQTILNWMSTLDHNSKQEETFSRREEGTGLWLFETQEFNDWVNGKNKVLWASGGPGAGKTILASSVVNYTKTKSRQENVGVAFLYCNYAERGTQTLEQLVGSIARQLFEGCLRLPLSVIEKHQSTFSRIRRQTKVDVLSEMISIALESFEKVHVIVDALDECDSAIRVDLVKTIRRMVGRVHLFCSSRYMIEDISVYFMNALTIRVKGSDEDIRIYLRAQINTKSNLLRLCKQHQGLTERIVEAVTKKTDGMFLLAHFHIEALAAEFRVKHLLRTLTTLPRSIWATYEDAVKRIFKGQDERKAHVARCVLLWASFSSRPLKVDEMQHAISAMELDEEDNIVDTDDLYPKDVLVTSCAGLVFIDENNFVRLVHYSIQEYLLQQRDLFPDGNLEILRTCMKYLSMDSFLDFESKNETGDLSMEEALYNSMATDFPLLHHSCRSWMKMVESKEVSDSLSSEILNFVRNKHSKGLTLVVSDSLLFRQNDTLFETFTQSRLKEKVLSLSNCFGINPLGKFTALFKAVVFNLPELTEMLLNHGEKVDRTFPGNVTSLHLAAFTGHKEVLRRLLQNSARVDIVCSTNWGERWTALHLASSQGHYRIVDELAKHGVDSNAEDTEGRTPLIIAARWSLLETLLGESKEFTMNIPFFANRSNLNATDLQGRDAFFYPHSPLLIGTRSKKKVSDIKGKACQIMVYPLYLDPYIDEILHTMNENLVLPQDDELMSWLSDLIANGDYPAVPQVQKYPNPCLYKDVLLLIPEEKLPDCPQKLLDAIGVEVLTVCIILLRRDGRAVLFRSPDINRDSHYK